MAIHLQEPLDKHGTGANRRYMEIYSYRIKPQRLKALCRLESNLVEKLYYGNCGTVFLEMMSPTTVVKSGYLR